MSKTMVLAAACGLVVSVVAHARAEDPPPDPDPRAVVRYDRGLRLSVDDWFGLSLNGLLQARYTLNHRGVPPEDSNTMEAEKHVTQGFDVARARFTVGVGLTDFVGILARFGVVAGGNFSFQQAFIDLKWNHFRLRGGVFSIPLIAESLVHPAHLLFADYSILANAFSPGSSKGVMMTYARERLSLDVGYSDGLRTGFSEIRAPVNADYALTLRFQVAWGRLGVGAFDHLDARRGTPFGVRLGFGAHFQDGGRTQGSLPVRIALGSLDFALQANGGALLLSGVVGQDMRIVVRELAAAAHGIPVEIYAFSKETNLVPYEHLQAEIFDHALVALSSFGLRAYQAPNGADVRELAAPPVEVQS